MDLLWVSCTEAAMGRRESELSAIQDEESLRTLAQLHQQLLQLLPYDAVATEAWFNDARCLLGQASNASQRAGWLTMLAWAYKQHLGQGIPLLMIMGRLLSTRDTGRVVFYPMVTTMVGMTC